MLAGVPTLAEEWPGRANYRYMQYYGAQVSSYLSTSVRVMLSVYAAVVRVQ